MPRTYQRKTRDCWRFYLNYGQGWEHEITEYTREEMKANRRAYRENCSYPLRVVRGRERLAIPEGGDYCSGSPVASEESTPEVA